MNEEIKMQMKQMVKDGLTKSHISKHFGVSKQTVYINTKTETKDKFADTLKEIEEATAKLIELYSSGLSYGLVVQELAKQGIKLSRSAVAGRINRSGVTRTASAPTLRIKCAHKIRTAVVRTADVTVVNEPRIVGGIDLIELNGRQCKWPIGKYDDRLMCCGANKGNNKSYCEEHHKLAHVAR